MYERTATAIGRKESPRSPSGRIHVSGQGKEVKVPSKTAAYIGQEGQNVQSVRGNHEKEGGSDDEPTFSSDEACACNDGTARSPIWCDGMEACKAAKKNNKKAATTDNKEIEDDYLLVLLQLRVT